MTTRREFLTTVAAASAASVTGTRLVYAADKPVTAWFFHR